ERLPENPSLDGDGMWMRAALKGIDAEIMQHLEHVGAVHANGHVLRQRMNTELVEFAAGMYPQHVVEVPKQFIDADRLGFPGLLAHQAEVTPRDLDAISHLPGHRLQPVLEEFEVLEFQLGRIDNALVH